MPANIERGEVAIILDGKEYVMVPSYENLVKIEVATGKSIVVLLRSIATLTCSLSDMAHIVSIGTGKFIPSNAGELLVKAGFANDDILKSIATFFDNALTGGKKPKGEAVAATDQNQA
jgi:hypothetical protein